MQNGWNPECRICCGRYILLSELSTGKKNHVFSVGSVVFIQIKSSSGSKFNLFFSSLSGLGCLRVPRAFWGGSEGLRRAGPHGTPSQPSLNPHWTLTEPPLKHNRVKHVWRVWKVEEVEGRSVFNVPCSVLWDRSLLPVTCSVFYCGVHVGCMNQCCYGRL